MFPKLKTILEGQPAYRYKQVSEALFKSLVSDWNEVSNLPKELKEKLSQEFPLEIKAQIFEEPRVVKALIEMEDGIGIESVLMMYEKRNSICISSQAGCALGCTFCATGQNGFKRNLTVWEIVIQVLFFARLLKQKGERIDNIVFMGMGEPFLNIDNVLEAIKIINDKDGLNIGARSISISTAGVTEGIKKLSDFPIQVNLAVSLHSPDDKIRSQLMPINKKYSVEKIFAAIDNYIIKTNRKVMLEYIMIDNVTDKIKMATELAELIKSLEKPLVMVNMIPYNESNVRAKYSASSPERMEAFKIILIREGIDCIMRRSFGTNIAGACGQLAGK
ncbi:MAG: 23S rRNA (adenine(2503)-C(2))-methyltransferase RlmN [Patescibacteria group bacterium]|jgi:23S rRNA (adenine2503-C2)-methyltransferase